MMRASTTVFTVTNVMESAAYYRDKLGFDIAFQYGEPTFYIGLCST
jgi:catechol 2,3-dioxygenase-like lactoylglutathione lyase family enzyme